MEKKQIFLFGACCSIVLGIIALLLPLAPFVSGTAVILGQSQTTLVSGFDLIFGEGSSGASVTTWILILVGVLAGVCGLVAYLLKQEKVGGIALAAGGVLVLVGSILYFFFVQFAGLQNASIGGGIVGMEYSLAFGAWLGGIIGIVGGALGIGIGLRAVLAK